jgi:hypothetical protein
VDAPLGGLAGKGKPPHVRVMNLDLTDENQRSARRARSHHRWRPIPAVAADPKSQALKRNSLLHEMLPGDRAALRVRGYRATRRCSARAPADMAPSRMRCATGIWAAERAGAAQTVRHPITAVAAISMSDPFACGAAAAEIALKERRTRVRSAVQSRSRRPGWWANPTGIGK